MVPGMESHGPRERIPDIELPPIPAFGHRGRRASTGSPVKGKDPPSGHGRWTWIVVLILGVAGGYMGGLGSQGLTFGLTAETGEASGSPSAPSGPTDSATVVSESAVADAVPDPGEPTRMDYVQGDGQAAQAGTTLPGRFGVQVLDGRGQPVDDVEIRFQVVAGGGVTTPAVARTDSSGQATVSWRLGPNPGFHRLTATSPGMETVVTFTAMARGADDASGRDVRRDASPVTGTVFRPPRPASPRSEGVTVVPRDFVVGGSTVCALSGGGVTCRGADDRGQRIEGGAQGTRALTAGLFHACALDAAGIASCWGANDAGQLGDGTRSDRGEATSVATDLRFSTLSAGIAHTCGLTAGGRLACWGQNLWGQLGDGSRDDRSAPGLAPAPSLVTLESGWNHTCAMTAGGSVYCWGLNRDGQVGDGTRLDRLSPRQVATSAESLAAGGSHTCALSQGTVLCWGDNRFGQLGDGTTRSRVGPTPVSDLPGRGTALVSGAAHTCALLADGAAYCWGQNLHGQLGNGSTVNAPTPTAVTGGITFARLSAGGGVTCGVSVEGVEYCWGLNQSGQLGDGSRTNRAAPAQVRR